MKCKMVYFISKQEFRIFLYICRKITDMYSIWIKYVNLFGIKNLSFKTAASRIAFFVLWLAFIYLWRQPLGDIMLLISYICVYERSRFDSKSYLDYVHLSSFSISGVKKFILLYLSHLLNHKFLFFAVVSVMAIISGYSNILHISVMLLALLIISLFTLNTVLMAMRSVKRFHIVKTIFSILMPAPFLLIEISEMHNIRDMIDDFYKTDTFYLFCILFFALPVCFILNYRRFKHIVFRKPFPSPEVTEKMRKQGYFSLF
jgi:hypothetical protein